MNFLLSAPFGGSGLSTEMVDGQRISASCDQDLTKDKWQILRDLTDCKHLFGLSDRALMVLSALLSFHKEVKLDAQDSLVVFPSNKKLSERAHGMAEPTLRRHLAALVKAGMIVRQDSPNGKRYAKADQDGSILRAFGFDLRVLLARSMELEDAAAQVRREKALKKDLREEVVLTRRSISKCLEFALERGAAGPWMDLVETFASLNMPIARRIELEELKELHRQVLNFNEDVHNLLEKMVFSQKTSGNDSHNERHKQDSNHKTNIDSEIGFPKKVHEANYKRLSDLEMDFEATPMQKSKWFEETEHSYQTDPPPLLEEEAKRSISQDLDLSAVLMACPDIAFCNTSGVGSWADLIEAAENTRSMMGISLSAWQDAKQSLGALSASVTIAAMLQRSSEIRSPGGYLRSLVARDGFTPKPMINSLLRANLSDHAH
ncbi:MAG TPA: replication initiation protein RepC [Rhizobiales bacterium]|nr:replication initiation protein RepC [Hyphomicrobiales bacterium]